MNLVYFFVSFALIALISLVTCNWCEDDDIVEDYDLFGGTIFLTFITAVGILIGGLILLLGFMLTHSLFGMPDCGCEHIDGRFFSSLLPLGTALILSYIEVRYWKILIISAMVYVTMAFIMGYLW